MSKNGNCYYCDKPSFNFFLPLAPLTYPVVVIVSAYNYGSTEKEVFVSYKLGVGNVYNDRAHAYMCIVTNVCYLLNKEHFFFKKKKMGG